VGKTPALTPSRAVAALAVTTAVTGCHIPAHSSSATVSLNQEVRDGKFAFTVTRVNISAPTIGIHTAQGTFVVVDITVANIGDEPRTLYCQNQKLKDLAGKTYDDAVTVGGGEDAININPGKKARVTCAFDVPKGTLTAAVEVHDRAYSPGATVQVLGAVR
jgi:Domain of unknown function (DUF4352)